jgi:hypothetical protein
MEKRMSLLWTPSEHPFDENAAWARLRAIEWKAFPAFISQPIVPVLLLGFSWYVIVIGIVLSAFIWRLIRWRFISIPIASAAAIFVAFMKWPLAVAMAIFFIFKGLWLNSIISFSWPLLVVLVSYAYAGGPKGLGDYEVRFMQEMGYDVPDLQKR